MKAVIVEDENLSARNLTGILNDIGDIEVIGLFDSIEDTVKWFGRQEPLDVLFLDIHLADGSSFEIFKQIEVDCPIIFTTAYDEYALNAFKVNSISYLLKPLKKEDVQQALHKLKRLRSENSTPLDITNLLGFLKNQRTYKSNFLVSSRGEKFFPLKVDDIAYIHIDESLIKAHTHDGKIHFMDQSLDELETQLDPAHFHRVNRQYILSKSAVKDIDQWFNSRLSVNLNLPVKEKILISRVKVPEFKNWFTGSTT